MMLPLLCTEPLWAQTTQSFGMPDASEDKPTQYVLPKQKLTFAITTYQILSDLALNRGDYKTAYEGYTYLANKTHDPRYAERAYWVAVLADDVDEAVKSAQLLKSIAPNARLGQNLVEQAELKKILDRSERGQLEEAYDATQAFLLTHPNHEVGLTFLADIASKLKLDAQTLYAFEALYKISPNDAETMNNLGYFLADRGIRLNQASNLIQRALKKSPKAPHIMDSAAWVAYRQNNIPLALSWAKKAHALSNAPDIALHLAEILWVGGDRSGAQALFDTLAQNANSDNKAFTEQLNQVMNRLGVSVSTSPDVAPNAQP